ncbi:MAG: M23 family metallopeptidase [Synechococcus sp.]|nr:M23 family metallopeptidase [Synechococcus sp.]
MAPHSFRQALALLLLFPLLGTPRPAAAIPDSASGAELDLPPPPSPEPALELSAPVNQPAVPPRPERPTEVPPQVAVGDLTPPETGGEPSAAGPDETGDSGALHYPLAVAATEQDPWGWRWSEARGAWRMHTGLDLIAPEGTEVLAVQAGRVLRVAEISGYGLTVLLEHGGGWSSLYAHLQRATVSAGDGVDAGQVLGLVGQSGNASTPHLHLELRRRQAGGLVAVDPTPRLPAPQDSDFRNRAARRTASTTAAIP